MLFVLVHLYLQYILGHAFSSFGKIIFSEFNNVNNVNTNCRQVVDPQDQTHCSELWRERRGDPCHKEPQWGRSAAQLGWSLRHIHIYMSLPLPHILSSSLFRGSLWCLIFFALNYRFNLNSSPLWNVPPFLIVYNYIILYDYKIVLLYNTLLFKQPKYPHIVSFVFFHWIQMSCWERRRICVELYQCYLDVFFVGCV